MDIKKLEASADALTKRTQDWEQRTIAMICGRIEKTGKLSPTDAASLKNIADITGDIDKLTKDMAQVLKLNVADMHKIYDEQVQYAMANKLPEYDFRKLEQVPFAENKRAQAVANAYARTTGNTFLNLSKTKALYLKDIDGVVRPLAGVYQSIIDKAVFTIANNGDFYGEMRNAIMQLGGSGVRVNYGSGVSRRLDTVMRQNLLWGAKQASIEYDEMMGEELGCDGFEVDYHSYPRPSHEFMGGKTFAIGKARTVKGIYYPSGNEALARLNDYGCLHDKYTMILGVSQSGYTKAQLDKLKADDAKLVEYNGESKTMYEWKQRQRVLETEVRRQKDIANAQKYSGDDLGRRQTQAILNKRQAELNDLIDATGLEPYANRTSVSGFRPVKPLTTKSNSSTINIPSTPPKISAVSDTKNYDELSKYLKDTYDVDIIADVRNLDFKAVSEALDGVEDVLKEFPQSIQYFEKVSVSKNGIMACGFDGEITFNPGYFNQYSTVANLSQFSNGFNFANSSIRTVGRHEAGHLLELTLLKSQSSAHILLQKIAWTDCAEAKSILQIAVKNAKRAPQGTGLRQIDLQRQISSYAATNASETMAEAVGDYLTNGQQSQILSQEIYKEIERRFQNANP